MTLRVAKCLLQDHAANKWQRWDLNPRSLALMLMLWTTVECFLFTWKQLCGIFSMPSAKQQLYLDVTIGHSLHLGEHSQSTVAMIQLTTLGFRGIRDYFSATAKSVFTSAWVKQKSTWVLPGLKDLSHEAGLREAEFSGSTLDKIKHLKGVQGNTFFF